MMLEDLFHTCPILLVVDKVIGRRIEIIGADRQCLGVGLYHGVGVGQKLIVPTTSSAAHGRQDILPAKLP